MKNTDLTSNKPRDRRLKDEEHRPNIKQTRDRRLKDEEHRPNIKQTKRQKIER
jgi:hypothetical protein